jgi:hypothetical protein
MMLVSFDDYVVGRTLGVIAAILGIADTAATADACFCL